MIHDVCMQEFFTCQEGHQVEAARVQNRVCRERLKDMYHEARLQCIITYSADVLGRVVRKSEAREMILQRETDLTRDQYIQVRMTQ
jgi:hypothetical protein